MIEFTLVVHQFELERFAVRQADPVEAADETFPAEKVQSE